MSNRFKFNAPKTETAIVVHEAASEVLKAQAASISENENGGLPEFTQESYLEYAKEYRERFPEETKAYTDEELYSAVGKTEDDMDDAGWKAYFLSSTPVTNTATEGETMKAKAVMLANKEGDELSAAVTETADAKEDWQGGPIKVLFALQKTYGEELASFPEPDSDAGNNPDKFKIPVTDSDGKTTMRPTTFYAQFTEATREGKAIIAEIEFINRAGNPETVKTGIPEAILAYNPQQRITRRDYLKGRLNTIRGAYKKAMALGYQLIAVGNLPKIVADFIYVLDKDGDETSEIANTPKPIQIYVEPALDSAGRPKPVSKWEAYSIGAFLKLDAKKAMENAPKLGSWEALKATVVRKPKTPGGEAKAELPHVKTADTFVSYLVEAFRGMDEFQSAPDQKEMGKLMKILNHKDANELKVTIVEFRNYLDDIVDEMKLGPWYSDLQAKRDPLVTRKAKPEPVKTAA